MSNTLNICSKCGKRIAPKDTWNIHVLNRNVYLCSGCYDGLDNETLKFGWPKILKEG